MNLYVYNAINNQSFGKIASQSLQKFTAIVDQVSEKAVKIAKQTFTATAEFFYEGSILHAFNNERLKKERFENKNLSTEKKCWLAFCEGINTFIKAVSVLVITELAFSAVCLKAFGIATTITINPTLVAIVVIAPILEEVIFRGCLQKGLCTLQGKLINFISTDNLQSNRVTRWLASRSCPVVITSICFGAVHLLNAQDGFMTIAHAIRQAAFIILFPAASILYETTDSLPATITMHATHNFFCCIPLLF